MSGGRRVLFDLQATQSVDQRHRGIPRYVADLAFAIEEIAPDAIDSYFLNPDLALPQAHVARRLAGTGKLRRLEDMEWDRASLLHIASPLEMTRPGHRLLPPGVRKAGLPYVVTFYDLIPHLMPADYLEDPGLRRRYRARLQLVRGAAGILTLSEATRADVVEHLGVNPDRTFVVGAGTSSDFVPAPSRAQAAIAAAQAVPGLRTPFVFYIGSYEKRKNLEPLLEAWSLLPEGVRNRWQLALCCPLQPLERNHLLHRAAALGITESVCLTGFVTDETLLLLHQGTDLFVFPSIYEGYGLPVAEALACGAPVLAGNTSSLPEILEPEALFDPTSPAAMAAAVERGLTDAPFRQRLLAAAGRAPSTWTDVAAATVAAYDQVLDGPLALRRDDRAQPTRVAYVGPVAPGRETVECLVRQPDVSLHLFADVTHDAASVPGVPIHPVACLGAIDGLEGPFDTVICALANDADHVGSLAALRRLDDAVVVTDDAYLAPLYAEASRAGALPGGLGEVIRRSYGSTVLPGTGRDHTISADEARRLGVLLSRDALRHSRRFLVRSEAGAELALLDAADPDRPKVSVAGADPAETAEVALGVRPARRRSRTEHPGPVVFDLQATQTVDQRHRGIARYVLDLALALEEVSPDHVGTYLVNPDLALPEAAERFVASGKLRRSDEVDWSAAGVLHTGSLFEMGVPLNRLLPPAALAAGVPWVVTFHDLIPLLMPESYLEDPGRSRLYRARIQLLRTADALLTNSQATRADAISHLGLDPDRVLVAGTGTGSQFVPPSSRSEAAAAAARAVPGLVPPFVLYVGNYDRRKNLEPFLEAWSRVDAGVRARYTLVVSAIPDPLDRNHVRHRAARLGIAEGLCVTGFVPEDVLLLLYQGTDLFVFPSLYEGYGLPVAEALACGAPVLAADTSSLPEIVGPEALFDPTDPERMAAAVERGLTDAAFRQQLSAAAGRAPSTWADVAANVVAAHDRILGGTLAPVRRTSRAPRRRLAVAGAFPPGGGANAGWNRDLLEELSRRSDLELHAFADRPASAERAVRTLQAPPGVPVHPLAALESVESSGGPFDEVVFLLADDEYHTGALAALRRRRGGVVVTHDVHLSELYRHAHRTGGLRERIGGVVRAGYGDSVTMGFNPDRPLDRGEARRLGILLCRDVLAHCRQLVVTRPLDATLADLDARPADRSKIQLAGPQPSAVAEALHDVLVGSSPP